MPPRTRLARQPPLLLGYQTASNTTSGHLDPNPQRRWRCLPIDHIDHIGPTEPDTTWATAQTYNPTQPFPHPTTTAI